MSDLSKKSALAIFVAISALSVTATSQAVWHEQADIDAVTTPAPVDFGAGPGRVMPRVAHHAARIPAAAGAPNVTGAVGAPVTLRFEEGLKGSSSFLKKRTKKLLSVGRALIVQHASYV